MRRLMIISALLAIAPGPGIQAADPPSDVLFLTLLESDADLEQAFPGEVVEQLYRGAELRTRRCVAGAADPEWLARAGALSGDPALMQVLEQQARRYLHEGALENLRQAGLQADMLDGFRARMAVVDDSGVDYGSCEGFLSVLQTVYDQPRPGEAQPAVVGLVCGQLAELTDCHGALRDAAATLPIDGGDDPSR